MPLKTIPISISTISKKDIPRSTLGRLVRRIRLLGQIACVPRGSYRRISTMHPAFQECIRRLYLLPTRLSMTAIREHTEMQQVATRLTREQGSPIKLPSYDQVRREIHRLELQPDLVATREGAKSIPLNIKRFGEGGVSLVECPDCGRTWTLSPRGGVLRFKSHNKRKTNAPVTGVRCPYCRDNI